MLTEDQIRLRLEEAGVSNRKAHDWEVQAAVGIVIDLLSEILPELVQENERLRRARHLSESWQRCSASRWG